MKFRCKFIFIAIILLQYVHITKVIAAVFNTITVTNRVDQATIRVDCNAVPVYVIFFLHNPERVVIDFLRNFDIKKNVLPMSFNDNSLVKCIRVSAPVKPQSTRIVIDLTYFSIIESITQKKINKNYRFMLTLVKKKKCITSNTYIRAASSLMNPKMKAQNINFQKNCKMNNSTTNIKFDCHSCQNINKERSVVIVAIDAGHGGQDPGATGCNGIYEKNVTINIAKKLKNFLDVDPIFSPVMIRDGDYFLSVMERSDIARKKRANVLVSIHTDAAMNSHAKGPSVWVLSNRRAKSEMAYLLQRSEKRSELLGGLGDVLNSYSNNSDPYFSHFILDLQFGYSQRVGYDIAVHILHQLKNISILHKSLPEYSGFGILRSPDIPSILVETGFISNKDEVSLLSNAKYQEKIARAIYNGLRTYFIATSLKESMVGYSHMKNSHVVVTS